MHLREKDDQYEEEDDDVVQEIDSNDVLVDSQEIFNFQNNWKTLYYKLIIWIFYDCLKLKLEQQICFVQTKGFYRSPHWSSPCHGETPANILFI